MKNAVRFIAALSGALLFLFTGGTVYLLHSAPLDSKIQNLYFVFVFLFAVLMLTSAAIFAYSIIILYRRGRNRLQTDITKAVLLSEANTASKEFSLISIDSALIGTGDSAYIDLNETPNVGATGREYAVVNRIENNWFAEGVSDECSIGLKRAGDQHIYKLKTGMCYKLRAYDILYIEKERLLFLNDHSVNPQ